MRTFDHFLVGLAAMLPVLAFATDSDSARGREVSEMDPRIWCVLQTRSGDHWFGSNGSGVYRFDGERLRHFDERDGLSGRHVRTLREDSSGNVLVATNSGVSRFDGEVFTALDLVPASEAPSPPGLAQGDVWMISSFNRGGPWRYDGDKLYELELSGSPQEAAFRARHPSVDYSPYGAYCVFQDRAGNLWVGTAALGLCRYDGETLRWMYEERLTTTPAGGSFGIRSIYEDRAGDFWICNTRQRFQMAPAQPEVLGYGSVDYRRTTGVPDADSDEDENFVYFTSITEDEAGALWMACGSDGVWKFDGEEVERFEIADGSFTISVYLDHAGQAWAGTVEHGVYAFNGERFERFSPEAVK